MPDRRRTRMKARTEPEDSKPMDPVALTLAVWLGLIASVTGLVRLSENAADQAARQAIAQQANAQQANAQQARRVETPAPDPSRPDPRTFAFGG